MLDPCTPPDRPRDPDRIRSDPDRIRADPDCALNL
jgi:hypothetical protein